MNKDPFMFYDVNAVTPTPLPNSITRMYKAFGRDERYTCGECNHLQTVIFGGTRYFKCPLYKISHSVATDWRKKWVACGKYQKKENTNE